MLDADVKAQLEGIVAAAQPRADNLTDIAELADPGDSFILYWNIGTGKFEYLALNTGLAITSDKLTLAENLSELAGLADPATSKILFWRQSTGQFQYITLGSGLTLVGDVLSAAGGGGAVPTLASGDFTPAEDDGTDNVATSAIGPSRYMRIGDVVSVSGHVELTAAADGRAQFNMELPISSDFDVGDLSGTATAVLAGDTADEVAPVAVLQGNADKNNVSLIFSGVAGLAIDFYYTFIYKVI